MILLMTLYWLFPLFFVFFPVPTYAGVRSSSMWIISLGWTTSYFTTVICFPVAMTTSRWPRQMLFLPFLVCLTLTLHSLLLSFFISLYILKVVWIRYYSLNQIRILNLTFIIINLCFESRHIRCFLGAIVTRIMPILFWWCELYVHNADVSSHEVLGYNIESKYWAPILYNGQPDTKLSLYMYIIFFACSQLINEIKADQDICESC